MIVLTRSAQAQTFSVLHTFTGANDGGNPYAGLTIGGTGTLYGTAGYGIYDRGLVFKMANRGSSWTLSPLYAFTGVGNDLGGEAPIVVGSNGDPYGAGGTVFELEPPIAVCRAVLCYWSESILYVFFPGDGVPIDGGLVFDRAGNIYGVTSAGGENNSGTVFELSPSGGTWSESVLYSFQYNGDDNDGSVPMGGVVFDTAGNLYGTTLYGGTGCQRGTCGTVYQLTPSNGAWLESVIFNFANGPSGYQPYDTLTIDQQGNLYGTTSVGGEGGGGTVFKLTQSNAGWTFSVLYSFTTCGSYAGLIMDTAGNLYGACYGGGAYGYGMIFKLTNSNGAWTLNDLHDFDGDDGANPWGNVVLDSHGNLYGTTLSGGGGGAGRCHNDAGCGVVWEITP